MRKKANAAGLRDRAAKLRIQDGRVKTGSSFDSHLTPFHAPRQVPLVYVASPISTYWLPRYGQMLKQIDTWSRTQFHDVELLPARGLYQGPEDWLHKWGEISKSLSAFAFFAAEDNTIGAGVLQEILDAVRLGVPVYYFGGAKPVPLSETALAWCSPPTMRQIAQVVNSPRAQKGTR
jgi:hypothetical protein